MHPLIGLFLGLGMLLAGGHVLAKRHRRLRAPICATALALLGGALIFITMLQIMPPP
jgi:hypothetical protein